MNLNQYRKDKIVSAIMLDVPKVDFDDAARKLLQAWAISMMPKKIADIYKTNPEWLTKASASTPCGLSNVYITRVDHTNLVDLPQELQDELHALAEKKEAQRVSRNEIETKLKAVISTCRTLKQAKKLLPEFEAYFPAEGTVTENLPVANLVAELTLAGWHAGKKS